MCDEFNSKQYKDLQIRLKKCNTIENFLQLKEVKIDLRKVVIKDFIIKFYSNDSFNENIDRLLSYFNIKSLKDIVYSNNRTIGMGILPTEITLSLYNKGLLSIQERDIKGRSLLDYYGYNFLSKIKIDSEILNSKNEEGEDLLMTKVLNKTTELREIDFLLKAGFDINTKNEEGENLIDSVLYLDRFYMNNDSKENLIKELIKRNCNISEMKNKYRFPKKWLENMAPEIVESEKRLLSESINKDTESINIIKKRL